jgi:hypothetical protein
MQVEKFNHKFNSEKIVNKIHQLICHCMDLIKKKQNQTNTATTNELNLIISSSG